MHLISAAGRDDETVHEAGELQQGRRVQVRYCHGDHCKSRERAQLAGKTVGKPGAEESTGEVCT